MKHAYLIISHNEFEILQLLIDSIDDYRNDIYVLFDKKVQEIPILHAKRSELKILSKRIDIYWGHSSQIDAELLLFSEVSKCNYLYCHLISGVHFPLYNQDYIHQYFNQHFPKQFLFELPNNDYETEMKVKLRSYFIKYYNHPIKIVRTIAQLIWVALLKLQRGLHFQRNQYNKYVKCSNWVSLTQDAIDYIVDNKDEIRVNFKNTFCADEFMVPTVLMNSEIKWEYRIDNRLIYQNFESAKTTEIELKDFQILLDSSSIFARKFSKKSTELINIIMDNYKKR